jgi:hypothetical protein
MKKARVWAVRIVCAFIVVALISKELASTMLDQFPPEHIYYDVASSDGATIALFSVKYQGLSRWIGDIEPHNYITLVDARTGRVKLRSDEWFRGETMTGTFIALARKHAPWAVDQLQAQRTPRSATVWP